MSTITHRAIIVSSGLPHAIFTAAQKAKELFGETRVRLLPPGINGIRTFIVPPCGSKDGWPDANEFAEKRAVFRNFLRDPEIAYALQWVEIEYGGEDRPCFVASS